jgi:hypothetical protein
MFECEIPVNWIGIKVWNNRRCITTFITATVTYTPDPADAGLAGQPLQIRLLAVEDPTDHSITGYVDFDDVKLSRSSGELSTVDLDLYEDMVINFKDFAVLADRFLDENGMFP